MRFFDSTTEKQLVVIGFV